MECYNKYSKLEFMYEIVFDLRLFIKLEVSKFWLWIEITQHISFKMATADGSYFLFVVIYIFNSWSGGWLWLW